MAGHIDAASAPLRDSLVAATDKLGSVPELVLHGGGNSSVKVDWVSVTGKTIPTLLVKGSGHDMAGITAAGFAPLDLQRVRELLPPTRVGDLEFADELRCAMLTSRAPDPSVESLVHALLPHTAVLHSHADAVLALTNTSNGAKFVSEALGDEVLIVNYAMPGPELGAEVLEAWQAAADRHQNISAIVVLQHGLFTMADTPGDACEKHLELVAKAEEFLKGRRPQSIPTQTLQGVDAVELAQLRRRISEVAGNPMIVKRHSGRAAAQLIANPELIAAARRGPATPDHVIWTGPFPMVGRDVTEYGREYDQYFKQHAQRRDVELVRRDLAPRIAIDSELGVLSVGRTGKEASAAGELFEHTIATIDRKSVV